VPRSSTPHRIVGKIAYCVDSLSTDRVELFMQKGMKQDTLDGSEGLSRETIVKGQAGRFRAGTGGSTEEETSKEDKREGAHL
jgi:hypothetical protein